MDRTRILKALADERRMTILTLLLRHNYCVRALARRLGISDAAVSQHLKVLRSAGLLKGEKRGYFMHYDVHRHVLLQLALELEDLAAIGCESCSPERGSCHAAEAADCHAIDADDGRPGCRRGDRFDGRAPDEENR